MFQVDTRPTLAPFQDGCSIVQPEATLDLFSAMAFEATFRKQRHNFIAEEGLLSVLWGGTQSRGAAAGQ